MVAVKVLPVVQEAKAASALYQPNIVTIHEISCEDGADFIVMTVADGKVPDQEPVGEKVLPHGAGRAE